MLARPSDYTTISTNFNGVAIVAAKKIWFTSVIKVSGVQFPITLRFFNQNIRSSRFNLSPPNGTLIITPTVTQATTFYTGSEWVTIAPPNLQGNYFLSGYVYTVPTQINGNLQPVSWTGVISSSRPCAKVEWRWGAAVYSHTISTNYSSYGVKPVDVNYASLYHNSDLAGTPENIKWLIRAGARGYGGSNFVGTYPRDADITPCSPTACSNDDDDDNTSRAISANHSSGYSVSHEKGLVVIAYPNPFHSSATIQFVRADKSGHTLVEIYSVDDKRVATLFDGETEAGTEYRAEFNGDNLPSGVYFYKVFYDDKVANGKLILIK
jgi:hypothetical protein